MNPKPSREETLFFAAAEMATPEERAAYLERECAGDAPLRQRVEALLAKSIKADAFFGEELKSEAEGPGGTVFVPVTEKAGDTIGRYKLLQQIGEGGCGVVYMAEQSEPVKRRVALKVIKLGMDTKQVVARFEAERQALALMDHPNIAKVLDGGATSTGRPFFVMELVRGTKITEFCDQQKLSTKERLDLFLQVCSAIQHAHQKGIIHRDIKPSNVLVTMVDGKPVPKVIDFGIAKATSGQELTDKTLFTAFEQFIGTPAYMSPEQAEMSGVDIDTRSDIYSLGVLLYELLTGRTPFDATELIRSGIDGIRKTLKEQEPPKPSTKLNTLAEVDLTTVANARHVEPPKLLHSVRGDLDWVVMKCLEKDRARRYETANGIAADLKRHLSNEPIVARPPSVGYLLQKAYRRNKLVFAAATAVALALLIGIIASTWQAVRAKRAEKAAEAETQRAVAAERNAQTEARRANEAESLATQRLTESEAARQDAEAVSKFLTGMFEKTRPYSKSMREVKVSEVLDAAASNLETELANQPERKAQLQATLGATYYLLGLYEKALVLREKVHAYYLAERGREHPETMKAAAALAKSLPKSRLKEKVELEEEVLAWRRRTLGPEHPDTLSAIAPLVQSYLQSGRKEGVLELAEQTLALRRKVMGPDDRHLPIAMLQVATCYLNAGRTDEALSLSEEALPLSRRLNGWQHPDTLWIMASLAKAYEGVGRNEEAINLLVEILRQSREVNGPKHPATLNTMRRLAALYESTGRKEEAKKLRVQLKAIQDNPDGTPEMEIELGGEIIDLVPKPAPAAATSPSLTETLSRAGNFAEAAQVTRAIIKRGGPELTRADGKGESIERMILAATLLAAGDRDGYRTACAEAIVRFRDTTERNDAERVAKICLLSADSRADATVLAAFVKTGQGAASPWKELLNALSEYRLGHWEAAADWARKARATPGTNDGAARAGAAAVLAMAQHQQKLPEEAGKAVAGAKQAVAAKWPTGSDRSWHDWLIAYLLAKEAETLINKSPANSKP